MIGARSVWSGLCGAQTASALQTPTDGSGSRPVSWSGERLSMAVHGQTRMLNAPAVSKSLVLFLLLLRVFFETKQLNCQLSTAFDLPSQAGWRPTASTANSRECQAYRLFPDTAEEYAPDVSLQGRIPRRYALRFVLLSTAPCKSPRARFRCIALSAV